MKKYQIKICKGILNQINKILWLKLAVIEVWIVWNFELKDTFWWFEHIGYSLTNIKN